MITKPRKLKTNKLRALKSKYSKIKKTSMAFFKRNRRSFGRKRSFRPRMSFRPRFRSGGYRRSSSIPIVGRFIPRAIQPLLVLAAIVGGAWYFFKEPLKGLLDKLKNHTA